MSIYVEELTHNGEGYKPLVDYSGWRVAILNHAERFDYRLSKQRKLERHNETDEVFVLLKGKAVLVIGGNGETAGNIDFITMMPNVLYNVKKAVWHHIYVSTDASVLIVENSDTGKHNTEYCDANISGEAFSALY
jgi:ureidoglycolate hydrolase